jgi:hypothetical protein
MHVVLDMNNLLTTGMGVDSETLQFFVNILT